MGIIELNENIGTKVKEMKFNLFGISKHNYLYLVRKKDYPSDGSFRMHLAKYDMKDYKGNAEDPSAEELKNVEDLSIEEFKKRFEGKEKFSADIVFKGNNPVYMIYRNGGIKEIEDSNSIYNLLNKHFLTREHLNHVMEIFEAIPYHDDAA